MEGNRSDFESPILSIPQHYGLGRKVSYIPPYLPGQKPKKREGIFHGFYQTAVFKNEDGKSAWIPTIVVIVEDVLNGTVVELLAENIRFKRTFVKKP